MAKDLIRVSAEDIKKSNGRYGSCTHCPIGYALLRAGHKVFNVWYDGIDFGDSYVKFPKEIKHWQMDQGRTPFEFRISKLAKADRSQELATTGFCTPKIVVRG